MLYRIFFRYLFNWGVYEEDIRYLGGTVEYSGEIVKKCSRYTVEKAVVGIDGMALVAHMKRYKGESNAVICCFEDRNGIVKDNLTESGKEFVYAIDDKGAYDDDFLEYRFIREAKQYSTFILQVVCAVICAYSMYRLFSAFEIGFLVTAVLAVLIIFVINGVYKQCRIPRLKNYKSKYFSTVNEDDWY